MRIEDSKIDPATVERETAKTTRTAQAASTADKPAVVLSLSSRAAMAASEPRPVEKRYAARVAALREQVRAGSYDIDLAVLAKRLFHEEHGGSGAR